MNALVAIRDDGVRASSLTVADRFEKRHDHVMRTIRGLLKSKADLAPNFGEMIQQVEIGKGGKRSSRYYEMDRKGFMLLVMGFTGAQALDWKIAFIDAFDAMEALLATPAPDPVLVPPEPEPGEAQDMLTGLAFVREARMVFGRDAARTLWENLGLPCVRRGGNVGPGEVSQLLDGPVADWFAERVVHEPGSRVTVTALFDDYGRWRAANGMPLVQSSESKIAFGRSLSRSGFKPFHSNASWRLGIRLRD